MHEICRYHYNVADPRLGQHVEKGNEDGLYISCVASASNLWALIMDAGTGFSSQVYELSAVFLHKVVIFFFFFMFLYFCWIYSPIYFSIVGRIGLWNNGRKTITSVP